MRIHHKVANLQAFEQDLASHLSPYIYFNKVVGLLVPVCDRIEKVYRVYVAFENGRLRRSSIIKPSLQERCLPVRSLTKAGSDFLTIDPFDIQFSSFWTRNNVVQRSLLPIESQPPSNIFHLLLTSRSAAYQSKALCLTVLRPSQRFRFAFSHLSVCRKVVRSDPLSTTLLILFASLSCSIFLLKHIHKVQTQNLFLTSFESIS